MTTLTTASRRVRRGRGEPEPIALRDRRAVKRARRVGRRWWRSRRRAEGPPT